MTIQPYKTVSQPGSCEIVVQKSRFIGLCRPVESQETAEVHLAELRKNYLDANHNCYAYTVGLKGESARFSDDGEPGGTAGRPMMEVLKSQELVDVLVVVTRYFGGTLLGAGGLVRAYSRAASEAVQAAGIIVMLPTAHYRLDLSYSQWNRLQQPLEKAGYLLENVAYGADVAVDLAVKQADSESFLQFVSERGDGQIEARWLATDFSHWPVENE